MNGILDYYDQAMLALAAYSNLVAGMSGMEDEGYKAALQAGGSGLSPTQASSFASKWKVIDQYTYSEQIPVYDDGGNITSYITSSNGLSVTIFEDIATGERHVAIRGTELADIGDLAADGGIILHGVPQLSEQYQALKTQIEAWQSNGTLAGTFTVTGHSLGGWLAAGLASFHVEERIAA